MDLRKNPYAGKDLQEELSGFKTQRLETVPHHLRCQMKTKSQSRFIMSVADAMYTNNSDDC